MKGTKIGVVAVEAHTLDEAIKKLGKGDFVLKGCPEFDDRCVEVNGHCHCHNSNIKRGCERCPATSEEYWKSMGPITSVGEEYEEKEDYSDYEKIWNKPERYEAIIHKPAVILIDKVTGVKFVSTAHDLDTFNPEVGLMMCFAKMAGMNYHKLNEILANARVIEDKNVETEKRVLPKKRTPKVYAVKVGDSYLSYAISKKEGEPGELILTPTPYLFNTKKKAYSIIAEHNFAKAGRKKIRVTEDNAEIITIDPTTMEEEE